ncbi:MAG: hypothetical protein PVH24_00645 [Candidatus Zixiibacteriota bacterium]|jgi:hypothetical protein
MTAKEKKTETEKRIDERQRFRYIGFEVFPGKPKDLFRSDAEKAKYIEDIQQKRSEGQLLRDHSTLTEERVTTGERVVLAVVSLIILATLFFPWYVGYTEVVESPQQGPVAGVVTDVAPDTLVGDTTGLSQVPVTPPGQETAGNEQAASAQPPADTTQQPAAAQESADTTQQSAPPAGTQAGSVGGRTTSEDGQQEMIHGLQARKKIHREYNRISALGTLFSIGSLGSYVFSSGVILIIVGVMFIVYMLLAIVLPFTMLYRIYFVKGTSDERALALKKSLKLNWIPVILFIVAVVLSFFGAGYGFANASEMYTSLGNDFGIAALMNSLSWGVFISLAAFILLAVKGIEI